MLSTHTYDGQHEGRLGHDCVCRQLLLSQPPSNQINDLDCEPVQEEQDQTWYSQVDVLAPLKQTLKPPPLPRHWVLLPYVHVTEDKQHQDNVRESESPDRTSK